MKNKIVLSLFIIVAGTILFFNLFCTPAGKNENPEESRYFNHHDTVDYVGIEACMQCHADKYQTYIETGMGQSFNTATPEKSVANFSGHHALYDSLSDFYYYPYFSGKDLMITEFRLSGKDTVHRRTEKISYIVGSGQHTNSHIISINGYLYQAPLTWYAQQGKWDLPPGFEGGKNTRFSRLIGSECMTCHNAYPEFSKGSENKFTKIPKGIDCERCHGPGEFHVNQKKRGILVDTKSEIDYSIVNPGKLPWKLQIDVCQRCHLQGNAVLKPGKTFFDFKPGMKLSSVMDVYMPEHKGKEEEFIMASHAERLQMSKCFIASNADLNSGVNSRGLKLTCITCHNPHVSVKVTGKEVFNNACKNCHQSGNGCTENAEIRKRSDDNCVACHMPRSGTIDIPHVSVHDHNIRKRPGIKSEGTQGELLRIKAVNNPDPGALSLANGYLSYFEKFDGQSRFLDSAAFYLNKKGDNPVYKLSLLVQLAFLKNDFKAISELTKDKNIDKIVDPWTFYRIGQSYFNLQDFNSSELWFARAVKAGEGNLEFKTKYGVAKMKLNKVQEAEKIFLEVLDINPKSVPAITNIGFVHLLNEKVPLAGKMYDLALSLDPDYEPALLNKAGLYNRIGEFGKSRELLMKILKVNPRHQLAREILLSLPEK